MTPVKYWSQTRQDKREIRVAYKAARIRFPFPLKCPDDIFVKLPKERQEAMRAGLVFNKTAASKLAGTSKASKAQTQSVTEKAKATKTKPSNHPSTSKSSWAEEVVAESKDGGVLVPVPPKSPEKANKAN